MNQRFRTHGLALLFTGLLCICAGIVLAQDVLPTALLGGDHTVFDTSVEAFTNPLTGLTDEQMTLFDEGDELFEQAFIAVADDENPYDGLGPLFNAVSCESCHIEDGRGRPPSAIDETSTGFLLRLALTERHTDGSALPDPTYGGQLQDLALDGMLSEGRVQIEYREISGTFDDGTPYTLREPVYTIADLSYGDLHPDVTISPRVANHMSGLGLLEAVPEETILSYADPDDADGDGISGRPNYVWDVVTQQIAIGRFGWKANQPNLLQQTVSAFSGDMGITTRLLEAHGCTEAQADCLAAIVAAEPEFTDEDVERVVFYTSALAVPAQRTPEDPQVQRGAELFAEAQCSACHLPELTTGPHPTIPQLSNQTIRPYTDLLLHDMGEGLADGQIDFEASGREWRTAPLWGIGLFETVNGHTYYLHDGRARNLMEAILWHGGEAEASRDAVLAMRADERDALIAFLQSL